MSKVSIDISDLTYCGKEASEIMAKEVYNLDIVNAGITLKDNVKGKQKVVNGSIGDGVWQEYSCSFSGNGTADLEEKYIETDPIKVNMEICIDDVWDTFMVEYTKITLAGGLPPIFSEWFFGELLKKMNKEYQEMMWKGDKENTDLGFPAYLKLTNGWEKSLISDAGELFTTTAFTSANILGQVDTACLKAIELAGSQNLDASKFKVFLNKTDVKLLEVALGNRDVIPNINSAVFANYARTDGKIFVYGFEVVPTEQSRSTVLVGNPKNLILGFDTYDSHLEYRILNMKETTGDNSIRVIALSNIGTQIVWEDTFTYGSPDYVAPEPGPDDPELDPENPGPQGAQG